MFFLGGGAKTIFSELGGTAAAQLFFDIFTLEVNMRFKLSTLAVAIAAAASLTSGIAAHAAGVTQFADGQAALIDDDAAISKDFIGGQLYYEGAVNPVAPEGSYASAFFGSGTPSDALKPDLNTQTTVSAGGFVSGELIGGSYLRTSKDGVNLSVASSKVVIDGGKVGENVIGGGKTNIYGSSLEGTMKSDVAGAASVTLTNKAEVAGVVIGGGSAKATGGLSTGADVGSASIVIENGSSAAGVVAGGHAYVYGSGEARAKADVTGTSAVKIDGAAINKANYQGYQDQAIEFAVVGGGLADASQNASGTASASVAKSEVEIVNGATVNGDVYAGGAALGTGASSTVEEALLTIAGSTVKGGVFSYGYAQGEGKATVTKSTLDISNTTVEDFVSVSGKDHHLNASNLTVQGYGQNAVGTRLTGIDISNSATATFAGDYLRVEVAADTPQDVAGIQITAGGSAEFASAHTVIDVSNTSSSGKWGYSLLVNGTETGGKALFTGGDVEIRNYTKNYTSQTLTVKAGSTIEFKNHGDVLVEARSPYGVTAVDAYGSLSFNNTGDVSIVGVVDPGDRTASTNVIGIQGMATQWTVGENVGSFNITLSGQGVDNNGTTYSTGTAAFDGEDVDFTFKGRELTVRMDVSSDVEQVPPPEHTAETASGLNFYKGSTFTLGENSSLDIEIHEGLGSAYAMKLAEESTADLQGNVRLVSEGVDASSAISLSDTSKATFAGAANEIVGDASVVTASTLLFKDGETNLTGNVSFDADALLAAEDATLRISGTISQTTTGAATAATGLQLTNSTLAIADGVDVQNFIADGATILYENVEDGTAFTTASSAIGEGGVRVAGSGALNDATADAAALMKTIAERSTTGTGDDQKLLAETVVLEEGVLAGQKVGQVGEDGEIVIVRDEGASGSVKTIGDAAASNLLVWRAEINSLNKRLGELRDAEGNTGAWVRVNAGSISAGDMGMDDDFVSVQLGADTKLPTASNIHVGAAFGYTDGDLSYDRGDGSTKSYSFALYGSWLGESGQFLDVIAKYARLSTDATAGELSADFDSNAYSLSAEAGWRLDCPTMPFFVEPQAELSYGYVDSQRFRVAENISAEQESMDTLVGRLGFRLGVDCPEKRGNVYLHASVLHDFLGETGVKMHNGVQTVRYDQDFGDTWFEYGVGGTFRINRTAYVYADLERTDGGDVDEDWRANLGVRLMF